MFNFNKNKANNKINKKSIVIKTMAYLILHGNQILIL